MASRLPTPGSDEGNWGDILNDYLRQSHTETGQIKAGAVTAVQLNPGAITTTAVAHGSITEAKLSQDVKDKLNALDSVTDGREVELRTNTTHLQWRYKGGTEGDWTNLVGLSEITGPQGATGEKGEKGDQGDPATNLVTSVAGKQGVVTLDKTDVGLDNVPNTDFTSDVTANTAARHTHTNKATLDATDATFTTAKDTKLSSIATGATQNATDASLRDRATHTGTQTIATVDGLQGVLDGKAATSHTHSASDLTATGTRNATTYLRGDNTWAAPTGDVQFSIQGTQSPVVLPANQFVTYPLEWIDYNIGGGVWDPATYTYRVPKNGLYLCLGGIRMEDGHASRSVATGIATTNADAGFVLWDGMGGQPSGRSGRQYMRITRFNAGDAVRLFIYSDTSFSTKSQRQGSFLSLTKIAD